MSKHLNIAIGEIEKKVILFAALVEDAVRNAVISFSTHNVDLANKVIRNDYEVDKQEIEIEEECLKILALHQPVAIDLRFIVAILKINSDLERVGDHAVSIARRAVQVAHLNADQVVDVFSYDEMIEIVTSQLKLSIDALINQNVGLAKSIISRETEVLDIREQMYQLFLNCAKENSSLVEVSSAYMFVSRFLERISDHAISIAEDVVYMMDGEIIRHQ